MRRPIRTTAALATLLIILGACDGDSTAPPTLDATGTVMGLVWLDRNGNEILDASDAAVPDVRVALRSGPGAPPIAAGVSSSGGEVALEVPVGDYLATVDVATVGDTLRLLRVDSATVAVSAGDTSVFLVGVTFPTVPVDSARTAPAGTQLFVEGRALHAWNRFGDATVHVRDTTGAIRLVRLPAIGIEPGDSLRAQGTVGSQDGEPVLRNVTPFLLELGLESPAAVPTTTGAAADADQNDLASELVRVDDAVLQDTTRNALGEAVLIIDDGSGPLRVVLDADISFFLDFPPDSEIIGTVLDATGLLKPEESADRWILKPRGSRDIEIQG